MMNFIKASILRYQLGSLLLLVLLLAVVLPLSLDIFRLNLVGKYQQITVKVAEGADKAVVEQAIASELPAGVEVVPTDQVVKESQDNLSGIINTFGTVLLAFAGISLFVAAFLIFNVFLIVVGQRVRELALLRAVGATGGQVAGSVLLEGVAVGLVASVIADAAGPRVAALVLGGFPVAWAGAWWTFTRAVRRDTLRTGVDPVGSASTADEFGPPEPDPVALGDR